MASRMGSFLRGYRAGKGLTLVEMADRIGVGEARLRMIEAGQIFPPASERKKIACRLGLGGWLDFDALWREELAPLPRVAGSAAAGSAALVAIINKAPAGEPQDYEEYGLHSGLGWDYVEAPAGFEGVTLFAFIVIGESMRGKYEPDDLVFCRPVSPLEDLPAGAPVFVRLGAAYNHRCTFKLWNVLEAPATSGDGETIGARQRVELRPANPTYPVLRVEKQHIAAVGLAVWRTPRYYADRRQPHVVQDEYSQT